MSLIDTKEWREALLWACSDPDSLNNAELERKTIFAVGGVPDFATCVATYKQQAAALVHDPAKLAELIAVEARRCGLRAMVADGATPGAEDWAFYTVQSRGPDGTIRLIRDHHTLKGWDAPMARAILAALLQLPSGARADAERVLRGET